MSLFDYYNPAEEMPCPKCGRNLQGWQGKDGPCGLFRWKQGHAQPIEQLADSDSNLPPEDLAEIRLPSRFVIYTMCCGGDFRIDAIGETVDGVWTTIRLMTVDDVDSIYGTEPKERRSARKQWLMSMVGNRRTGRRGYP